MKRFLFLLLLVLSLSTLLQAQQPTLEINPSAPTVGVGGDVYLTVHARDFPPLRTYGIRLSYDTTLVRCYAVEKAGFFSGYSTFYFRQIDSLRGEAGADESILGPGWTLDQGGLFIVRFKALKQGTVNIGYTTARFFDSSLAQIPDVQLLEGSFVIDNSSSAGEPPLPAFSQLDAWPQPWNPARQMLNLRLHVDVPTTGMLRIVDMAGRVLHERHTGMLAPGVHALQWDGRMKNGSRAGSGVYHVILRSERDMLVKRFIVTATL